MAQKIDIEALLQNDRVVQFMPQGYSMYPLIDPKRGDQVVVQPFGMHSIKRGDVVLYRREGEPGTQDEHGFENGILVIHRVWKVKKDGIYLVGDNQKQIEGPLRREQLLGLMTARIRKEKMITTANVFYQLSTGLWLLLRPMRPVLSKIAARIKKGE